MTTTSPRSPSSYFSLNVVWRSHQNFRQWWLVAGSAFFPRSLVFPAIQRASESALHHSLFAFVLWRNKQSKKVNISKQFGVTLAKKKTNNYVELLILVREILLSKYKIFIFWFQIFDPSNFCDNQIIWTYQQLHKKIFEFYGLNCCFYKTFANVYSSHSFNLTDLPIPGAWKVRSFPMNVLYFNRWIRIGSD